MEHARHLQTDLITCHPVPHLCPIGCLLQLTRFIAAERPAPLRGGILADDMGLGKTLEVGGCEWLSSGGGLGLN